MSSGTSLLFVSILAGCGPRLVEDELGGARHVYTQISSNNSGTAHVKIPVYAGETAMLATVRVASPNKVHVRSVFDPAGTEVFRAFEWNASPYSKTNAGFVADTVSLNWPVLASDAALGPGKWELEFGVVDAANRYTAQDLDLDVIFKPDADFSTGALEVSIVYVGGLDQDEGLREAVDGAKELWVELYASMGIDVSFDVYAYDQADLAPPAFGKEDAYVDIAEQTAPLTVNLVISPEIEGFSEIFGIAGDIPGPLIPTTRSGVQISATLAAGPDGEFDDEDTRLLAETMAHEVLHYLGLFHPVESTWDAWDVLDDTAECESESRCIDELGDNLMFPYPVCGAVSCTPQDALTGEQASVANRYVGVR